MNYADRLRDMSPAELIIEGDRVRNNPVEYPLVVEEQARRIRSGEALPNHAKKDPPQ